MTTMNVQLQDAPSTPLNLRFGVLYAPRVPTPPFVAYEAVEVGPSQWNIRAYDAAGIYTVFQSFDLLETYRRMAAHLRLDVSAH